MREQLGFGRIGDAPRSPLHRGIRAPSRGRRYSGEVIGELLGGYFLLFSPIFRVGDGIGDLLDLLLSLQLLMEYEWALCGSSSGVVRLSAAVQFALHVRVLCLPSLIRGVW